ncbi:MAG TPA: hypothetical protein VF601_02495 [Beijerinckiaceae bacterium]
MIGMAISWELRISRIRQEKRRDKPFPRTISRYQVFHDNEAVDHLSGFFVERQGPGDNSRTGTNEHRRIEAGRYPISTHESPIRHGVIKYKAIGYTNSNRVGATPRVCIGLDDTGHRRGILIHPGQGYIWSVGCLNPGKVLNSPADNLKYAEGREMVIALIEDLAAYLGDAFPRRNNRRIPYASVIITGEPR